MNLPLYLAENDGKITSQVHDLVGGEFEFMRPINVGVYFQTDPLLKIIDIEEVRR
jgi:hypothetical protein